MAHLPLSERKKKRNVGASFHFKCLFITQPIECFMGLIRIKIQFDEIINLFLAFDTPWNKQLME